MLPDTPARGALEVAERIRRAIQEVPFTVDAGHVSCTVSIGVASFPSDGRTIDALLARADRALYQAKEAGRNRVAQHDLQAGNGTPPPAGTQLPGAA